MVNLQHLTSEQVDLYGRLQAFSLDEADATLPFSQRLARENGWSLDYAKRVIEEYKKFAFLAVVAGHPVTPSDAVDQAWHLHLTYTRSYWEDFCSNGLQTPLHHDPTRGGASENEKFEDWYEKTLESYNLLLGEAPPADIWHPATTRFGQDLHFVRLNTQQYWVIPRLQIWQNSISAAVLVSVIFALIAIGSYSNNKIIASGFLILILGATCVGAVFTLVGVINALKPNNSRRIIGPGNSSVAGCGSCSANPADYDLGKFFNGHHGSHHGSHDSGGCGGVGCGGCSGAGCGGGGCGSG